jgi:hypothetical protein
MKQSDQEVEDLQTASELQVKTQVNPKQKEKEVILDGIEIYSHAIVKFRMKIISLVESKVMSEQTASKIILEQEYNLYNQVVTILYE